MSNATEHSLGDDKGAGASSLEDSPASASASRSAALAQQLEISDVAPPWMYQQLSRVSSLVFNGGLVALVRAWANPPTMEVPEGGSVPEWYVEEWSQRTRWRRMGNQVARDTAALAGMMLLMDGVEDGMRRLRDGTDDPWNRVMGGVTAGGLLGLLWHPTSPRGRAYMTAAGSFVGYFSYVTEKMVDASLLNTQRELERELLQKPADDLRTDLSRPYLQSLLKAKRRQMQEAARREMMEKVAHEQRRLAEGGRPTNVVAAVMDMQRNEDGGRGPAEDGSEFYGVDGGDLHNGRDSSEAAAASPRLSSRSKGSNSGQRYGSGSGGSLPHDRGVLMITEGDDSDDDDDASNKAGGSRGR